MNNNDDNNNDDDDTFVQRHSAVVSEADNINMH